MLKVSRGASRCAVAIQRLITVDTAFSGTADFFGLFGFRVWTSSKTKRPAFLRSFIFEEDRNSECNAARQGAWERRESSDTLPVPEFGDPRKKNQVASPPPKPVPNLSKKMVMQRTTAGFRLHKMPHHTGGIGEHDPMRGSFQLFGMPGVYYFDPQYML